MAKSIFGVLLYFCAYTNVHTCVQMCTMSHFWCTVFWQVSKCRTPKNHLGEAILGSVTFVCKCVTLFVRGVTFFVTHFCTFAIFTKKGVHTCVAFQKVPKKEDPGKRC